MQMNIKFPLIVIILLMKYSVVSTESVKTSAFSLDALSQRITSSLLATVNVQSKLECAARCLLHSGCSGFGFTKQLASMICSLGEDDITSVDESDPSTAMDIYKVPVAVPPIPTFWIGYDATSLPTVDTDVSGSVIHLSAFPFDGKIVAIEFYSASSGNDVVFVIFTRTGGLSPCGDFKSEREVRLTVTAGYNFFAIMDNSLSFTAGQYYGIYWDNYGVVSFQTPTPQNYCYLFWAPVLGSTSPFGDFQGDRKYSMRVSVQYA